MTNLFPLFLIIGTALALIGLLYFLIRFAFSLRVSAWFPFGIWSFKTLKREGGPGFKRNILGSMIFASIVLIFFALLIGLLAANA